MNERHLFRAKRNDDYKQGEWEVGCLVMSRLDVGCKWDIPSIQDSDGYRREIDPSTIGQCTGLQDCAGEWIYEGDRIAFGGEVYIISFSDACFWITQPGYAMELHTILGQGEVRVVGNIHGGEAVENRKDAWRIGR